MTRLIQLAELATDSAVAEQVSGGAVSIGNFDGVHRGHRELLGQVRRAADAVGGPAVVVVLDPHPAAVLRPHSAPARLTTVARRAELMSDLGIDALVVCPATIDFLNRTAEDFFRFLLLDRLSATAMVEGPNFFFGRDRGGDVHRLREFCDRAGVTLTIVDPATRSGRMISSSRIRESIAAGDIPAANEMLGSNYQVSGRVASGAQRGRTLGFPTANLVDLPTLPPGDGVYAGFAPHLDRAAAIHIGPNPTFLHSADVKIEVHLLDYNQDLYGQTIAVEFIDRIRGVQKFDGPDALIAQVHDDLRAVRQRLSRRA